jgi:hypothetical protein
MPVSLISKFHRMNKLERHRKAFQKGEKKIIYSAHSLAGHDEGRLPRNPTE